MEDIDDCPAELYRFQKMAKRDIPWVRTTIFHPKRLYSGWFKIQGGYSIGG
jgi:hypothetical protein